MIRLIFSAILFIVMGTGMAAMAAAPIPLVQEGKSSYVIAINPEAPPSAHWGAQQVRLYIQQITGVELQVISQGPLPEHAIIIGPGRFLDEMGIALEPALGDEGFILRTVGDRVVAAGPGVRGTLYACDELLERLGVRWFTPKVTHVPHSSTLSLPPLDEKQIPDFEFREPYFTEAFDAVWSAHNRLNGVAPALTAEMGGHISYGRHALVHTFDALIPRSLYADHPEYFPLIGGRRVDGYVQRCLSNPEVLRLAIAGVEQWIREEPDATIFSVSQNDTGKWCKCEKCTAIANRYGGQSGLYLWFANEVAAVIGKEHPDKLIDTLAYQFTEAPPTGIRPLSNVRIRLCPIDASFAGPFEQSVDPATQVFVKHLRGWSALTDTLYIWHYNINFRAYLQPFPDFNEFPSTLKLYKRMGVKGVFFQGDYAPGGGGSDAELRSYVMAKILWNQDADADAIVNEWMQGVYKKAARPMRQWFDLLHKQVASPNVRLGIFDTPTGKNAMIYLPPEVLQEGARLTHEAAGLAEGDPHALELIAKAQLGIRYVQLMRDPVDLKTVRQFAAEVRQLGITQLREGRSIEWWEQLMAVRLKPAPQAQ